MPTTRNEALDLIDGEIIDGNLIYFANETGLWYVSPEDDLDVLMELMDSTDDDIRRDAYSHWCRDLGCSSSAYVDRIGAGVVMDMIWHQMPRDGGQIVDVKYSVDFEAGVLYRKTLDRSDNTTALNRADLDKDGSTFEPQNGILPKHGAWVDIWVNA